MNNEQTIAQQLKITKFPFIIKDDNGCIIYYESIDWWCKRIFDDRGNLIYLENSKGFWYKSEWDDEGNEIYYEMSTGSIVDNRKEVEQFDLDGNFIKTWESITKVEKELKIYNINAVCKGIQETDGGYKWKYKINENE